MGGIASGLGGSLLMGGLMGAFSPAASAAPAAGSGGFALPQYQQMGASPFAGFTF